MTMEKILSKSKSRYFFLGKKKNSKEQGGVSGADVLAGDDVETHAFDVFSGRDSSQHATAMLSPAGVPNGSLAKSHASHITRSDNLPARLPFENNYPDKSTSASKPLLDVSINNAVLPPINVPSLISLAPSGIPDSPLLPTPSPQLQLLHAKQRPSQEVGVEDGRAGDAYYTHSRSQSALTPGQFFGSQARFRRQGIPESFKNNGINSSRGDHIRKGQNLNAEPHISDRPKDETASGNSNIQPSASAPVATNLYSSLVSPDLATLSGSPTVPDLSKQSALPRSTATYNLSGLAPPSSSSPPIGHVSEMQSSHPSRPRRTPPPPPASPAISSIGSTTGPSRDSGRSHIPNGGTNPEKEMGYRGLVFPLPPSSEDGQPTSYSSSQSSVLSVAARQSGDPLVMQTKALESKGRRDDKEINDISSRVVVIGPLKDSSRLNAQREQEVSQASKYFGRDREETINKGNKMAFTGEDGFEKPPVARHIRPDANSSSPHPQSARPLQQQLPKDSETTNGPSFVSSLRTLHTVRSFSTGLNERKQLHPSASNRDLSSRFKVDAERGRTANMSAVMAHRRDITGAAPSSKFSLPTPPHSAAGLPQLAEEPRGDNVQQQQRSARGDVADDLIAQRERFRELAGYAYDVSQRNSACESRIGVLESAVAKMEREIRGLRWLVLEYANGSQDSDNNGPANFAQANDDDKSRKSKLRRSLTVPSFAMPPQTRQRHARSKRDAIGLGLGFSPESLLSSSSATLATPQQEKSRTVEPLSGGEGGKNNTPGMDEIVDKLMSVRQWASADMVSVVGADELDGDESA